jgi:phosphate transport system substrate-binding protein
MSKVVWLAGFILAGITAGAAHGQNLKGEIKIDGSSTVYLITEKMATNFRKTHPGVSIPVGIAGTGGGIKKFINGETDISNASRAFSPTEIADCKKNGIEPVELQVAWDGLAVIIHPENTWATKMTMEQLKKIWHPDSAPKKWKDVDPTWPDENFVLYGAGSDSGTYDYFTGAVNGKERLCRSDYSGSENDLQTIRGVVGSKYSMGFLGVAYYEASKDKLGVVQLSQDGKEYFAPTSENVLNKTYPISRPLFIYVKKASLARPEVREFVEFYVRRADLVEESKYVQLTARQALKQREALEKVLKEVK